MKKSPHILFTCLALLSFVLVSAGQTPTLYSTTVSNDNPLLYWNFDAGSGGAAQQMPIVLNPPLTTQNDLIPTNGATRVSHASLGDGLLLGNAAALSGSNYFISTNLFTGQSALANGFAVELWIQSLATNSDTYLYNIGNNGANFIFDFDKPDYLELYTGAGGRTGTAGPEITDTNWHHVLCVYYGNASQGLANEVDFYVDVTNYYRVEGLNISSSLPLDSSLIFGAASTTPANGFAGNLDEFAIYDLSSYTNFDEAQTAMTNMAMAHEYAAFNSSGGSYSNAVVASGPTLYWNFDEASGDALQLIPITTPPNNPQNTLLPSTQAAYVSHASLHDGLQLGDAIQLNGASSFYTAAGLDSGLPGALAGPWAVEFWMQDTEYPQSDKYLFFDIGNTPAIIYGFSGENLEVYSVTGGRSGANGIPVTDKNWHYVLAVNYNSAAPASTNRVDFFIDGLLHSNVGGGFNTAVTFASGLILGNTSDEGNTQGYVGNMDELAVYDLNSYTNVAGVQAQAALMSAKHYAAGYGLAGITNIQQLYNLVTIDQQPSSVTNQVGGAVSFTASASASSQLSAFQLNYQWQLNGESILGATNATYDIPILSIDNIGTNAYTVRVSAGPAFQISKPAYLVVPTLPPAPPTEYDQAVTQSQPLLYWNFDQYTGPADEQVLVAAPPVTTQNNLVPIDGATRVSHASLGDGLNLGNAASLTGNDYFMATNMVAQKTALSNGFAVEMWVQSQATNSATYLYNMGNNSGDFIFNFDAPDYLELYAGSGGRTGKSSSQITDTNWHYVLCVYYGSASQGLANEVDFYVDATNYFAETNLNINASLTLNSSLIFGAANTTPANGFTGNLDEFAIYDLSSYTNFAEIQAAMTNMAVAHLAAATNSLAGSYSNAVVASNPYLYWNFDETSGPAAQLIPIHIQIDPTDNELVESGGAGLVQHSVLGDGLYLGNAADLDGASVFYAAGLDTGRTLLQAPWAVEFWVQSLASNVDTFLLDFGATSPNGVVSEPGFIFNYPPYTGASELDMCSGGSGLGAVASDNITASGVVITDTNWHYVVWVDYGDGTTGVTNSSGSIDDRVDLYLDGTNYSGVQNTFSSALDVANEMIVGGDQPGYLEFQGRMDEIAVYDLSAFSNEDAVTSDVQNLVAVHEAAALVPPSPTLNIALTGGQLILTWSSSGYMLQKNSDLSNRSGWSSVSGGNASPVTISPLPSTPTFYRLISQ